MDFSNPVKDTLWEYLTIVGKPIVLYGMGDGAVKVINALGSVGLRPAEVMASDEFVRGHSFLGYKVKKLSDIEAEYDDFIILVCFGSSLPSVMEHIFEIAQTHELYIPHVPVTDEGLLFNRSFYNDNLGEIEEVYKLLADDVSRKVYENLIMYRLTAKPEYLREAETPRSEAYELIKPTDSEVFVDLGAYNGDTIAEFINATQGHFKKIYALEPDTKNYEKLRRRLYMYSSHDLEAYNAGAWSSECTQSFSCSSGRSSSIVGKRRIKEVKMMTVDGVLRGGEATIIKYDVEGSESHAIEGSVNTIKQHKPRLMISVYHRNEDIFKLPLLIHSLNKSYKIYLRHHEYIPDWDTNIYCI